MTNVAKTIVRAAVTARLSLAARRFHSSSNSSSAACFEPTDSSCHPDVLQLLLSAVDAGSAITSLLIAILFADCLFRAAFTRYVVFGFQEMKKSLVTKRTNTQQTTTATIWLEEGHWDLCNALLNCPRTRKFFVQSPHHRVGAKNYFPQHSNDAMTMTTAPVDQLRNNHHEFVFCVLLLSAGRYIDSTFVLDHQPAFP